MFERSKEVSKRIDSVYRVLDFYHPGEDIPKSAIDDVLTQEITIGQRNYVIKKAKERLLVKKGILCALNSQGCIHLCTPQEQYTIRMKQRAIRGTRHFMRGRQEARLGTNKGLTDHERRAKEFNIALMSDEEKRLRKLIRDSSNYFRPTPTLPRRPPALESEN